MAILLREPFSLSIEQVGELDDWQIVNLLLRPGDEDQLKDGVYYPLPNVDRKAKGAKRGGLKAGNFRAMYFAVWRERGLDEDAVQERWRNYLERNPGLALSEPKG